jgi:hypothetical protein
MQWPIPGHPLARIAIKKKKAKRKEGVPPLCTCPARRSVFDIDTLSPPPFAFPSPDGEGKPENDPPWRDSSSYVS